MSSNNQETANLHECGDDLQKRKLELKKKVLAARLSRQGARKRYIGNVFLNMCILLFHVPITVAVGIFYFDIFLIFPMAISFALLMFVVTVDSLISEIKKYKSVSKDIKDLDQMIEILYYLQ
jgi:hypothetical protein